MKEGMIEIELDSIAHERAVHEQGHLAKAERNSERCEQLVEGSSTVPYGICRNLEVTIPEENDATVAIQEQKTECPKSHLEVTIYARHQAKGEKGLLQTVPGKVEDAKIAGRNPLPAPRFTRDTKLKKQGTTGKKANVKAAQDMTAKSKTSSLVKTACSEGDNLPGYLQQLHISVLSDGSKQVSRSAEHSSTSSEDREVSVKSTDSLYSCGGTENNLRNAEDESTEKNNQHVTHGTCRVTKKQEQSSKKTTGAAAGSATALVHSGLAPKPTEAKFRPDCRAGAFVSTYQRGRRKLPVISTKYRYVASQRTTRTDPSYRHQQQGIVLNASASTSQKAATGSPVSGIGNRMQSPACSDDFSGMASKSGGSTAGTQVLLKSPGTTASKSISSSSQLTVHKSMEQGARSPYKKDNTQYSIDSSAVDVSAGRKKTTLRKTTLIRHPRNRAQMPMVRSAQYTNSSFEEDPKMCYTLGDGRKIVFSPNAVNTPLNKAKKVHEEKRKAASGGSNTPSNDTEEGPSEAGKEAVRCNSATEANRASVKENKAQNETCAFDTPDKYQETAQQSPQKSATAAAAIQCSIPNGRAATKHQQDSSELHAMEEMLLAPTSALPVATNNFQASYGGPAAKPRLYREQHQQQQQQQGQQQQQQHQQQQQQQQQPQQFSYGAETYPDHYHQSFPDGRLSLFDSVPNRCAVQSSNAAGIRHGHYVRDMLSRIDDVQQHTQHFSSNQDIRTNRTVFDTSVNLLTEASVLGGCATSVRTAAVAVSSREQYHLLRCEGCSATVPVLLPSAPEEILTCSSLRCLVQLQTHFGIKAIPTHAEPPLQLFTSSVGLVPIREVPVTYPLSNASVQQPFLMDLQQFVQLNDQQHNMVTLDRISTNDMPISEPAQRAVPIDRNSARFGDTWTPFGHPPLLWHDWSQYSSSLQPSDFAMPEVAPGIIVEPQQPLCNREQNSSSLHTSTDGLQLQEGNNNVNTAFYPPSRRSVSTPLGHYSSGAELHPNKNIACVNVEGQYYS
ncbi:uncharacterized protein LOC126293407 isoform X2 [Schistocerca gregaria]|uniref:uncharacterized protein LOC126293407 isoform X2 n=1 Tax=Schistocerca gregaria TaxID=7010 RepID=UPI00211E49EA|nr:uncharacterized protein LOC126293407 isoform X2 [Schistocerca gregaria]